MQYLYTISSVDIDQLTTEIANSSIVTAIDHIQLVGTDDLEIYFKATLSSQDEDTLDAIVTAHVPIPRIQDALEVTVLEQAPFAKPDYRTKRAATNSWQTCPQSAITNIDYQVTEERYVNGGEIIYKNIKQGDFIVVTIEDLDNLIPEPYREELCEAHPIVATYVEKKWLRPASNDLFGTYILNTHPLAAKVTPGLYIRVAVHTTAETGDREMAVNFYMSKKL